MNSTHSHKKTPKILLVEDEKIALKVHHILLQGLGYTADIAETGWQALRMCQLQRYNFILMDIILPDINGFELTRQIHQAQAPGQKTPVVALTAFSAADVQDKCLLAGIETVMTKPVNATTLRAIMNVYLQA